jgi:hypothetical protein
MVIGVCRRCAAINIRSSPTRQAWQRHRHAAFAASGPLFWPYDPFWHDAHDDAYWPCAYYDLFDDKPDVPRLLGWGFRGQSGKAGFEVDSGAEIDSHALQKHSQLRLGIAAGRRAAPAQ